MSQSLRCCTLPSLFLAAGLWQAGLAYAQHDSSLVPPDAVLAQTDAPKQPAPGCICGGRTGLFGWRKHTAACKRHLQEHFLGYLEEFNEWPLGSALYALERTQVSNSRTAQQTFYDFDFVGDSATLNLKGRQKMARVATELPRSFTPILIEQTARYPGLAELRRQTMLAELSQGPFPVPPERIIVCPPISTGLSGPEATVLFGTQMGQLGGRGGAGGSGITSGNTGFNGGFDSSGLSAPAMSNYP